MRRDARRRVKAALLELAATGAQGRELALAVEHACPYAATDRPRRRAWQEARRRLVGRVRHAAGYAREYTGVLAFEAEELKGSGR
jgi:hypothetical protein